MTAFELDPSRIRDVGPEVLGPDGRLRVLPAAYWATTTPEERALFGHRHGIYGFPTEELVAFLRAFIGERTAIEIGAGHGVLADALGIVGTDSKQQQDPKYRAMYERMGQPTTCYGPNVVKLDAREAIRKYRPQVVIGCWVTHKYTSRRHHAGGNEAGVNEEWVIEHCDEYAMVGNEMVHATKSIWTLRHALIHAEWLYSRAHNGSPDFIAVWS